MKAPAQFWSVKFARVRSGYDMAEFTLRSVLLRSLSVFTRMFGLERSQACWVAHSGEVAVSQATGSPIS